MTDGKMSAGNRERNAELAALLAVVGESASTPAVKRHKKQRKRERSRNAENHAALLAAVGETQSTPAVKKRISLYPELKELGVRHSRRQIDRLEAAEKFPKRVALGEGRVGWITDEIIAHVDKQIESRSLAAGTLGSGDFCRRAKPARVALHKVATNAATAKAKPNAKAATRRAAQPHAHPESRTGPG